MKSRIVLLAGAAILAGCGGDPNFPDLHERMDEYAKRPKGNIEAPPEFKAYTSFTYGAVAMRSPFSPPVEVESRETSAHNATIKPDLDRPKEPLEEFGIDSLSMVGSLNRPGNILFALIKDTAGSLHRVAVGNFMGRNFGKVVEVSPQKVEVVEIVSDGQSGWIERPHTITLREQK